MESGGNWNFEDYIRFLFCHLFGPVNHGQNWKGWERSGEKGLIINDNQTQTCLIVTINDTSTGDLPLIINISDTCKNQPKRLDFDNTINLSSLIVRLTLYRLIINNNRYLFYLLPKIAQSVKMWTVTRKGYCFTCYPQFRWRTCRISFSHSPITFGNISVINLVSIFRCSSSKTNSVYVRRVNSLVLGCSLS